MAATVKERYNLDAARSGLTHIQRPDSFGPYILCAEIDNKSSCRSSTLQAILPTVCTASLWKRTPRALTMAPISANG